jgi:small basic protein
MNSFWSYWYFHIPNFILAAVMYTLIGRLVLGLFVPEDWDNYIWRGFRTVTDPAVRAVRVITPQLLDHMVVLVFSILWILALRIAYLVVLLNLGLAPVAPQGG